MNKPTTILALVRQFKKSKGKEFSDEAVDKDIITGMRLVSEDKNIRK